MVPFHCFYLPVVALIIFQCRAFAEAASAAPDQAQPPAGASCLWTESRTINAAKEMEEVREIAWSPDGRLLKAVVSGVDSASSLVEYWIDPNTQETIRNHSLYTGFVHDLQHDLEAEMTLVRTSRKPKGSSSTVPMEVLVVTHYRTMEDLFEVPVARLNNPERYAFDPSGKFLACAGNNLEDSVLLIDLGKRAVAWESVADCVPAFPCDGVNIGSFAYSRNSAFLGTSSEVGIILRRCSDGKVLCTIQSQTERYRKPKVLAVDNEGSRIVIDENGGQPCIRVMDVHSGRQIGPTFDPIVREVEFSPDAQKCFWIEGDQIHATDLERGGETGVQRLPCRPRMIKLSPDGKRLAVLLGSGKITVLNLLPSAPGP